MVDDGQLVGKGRELAHSGGKLEHAHLVLRAQNRVREAPRRGRLFAHILVHAARCVDGQRQIQRQLRLPLEDGDLLRAAIFEDGKVVAREPAHNGAVLVRHVDEDVDELHVHVERGRLLRGERERRQRQHRAQAGAPADAEEAVGTMLHAVPPQRLNGQSFRERVARRPHRAVDKGLLLPDGNRSVLRVSMSQRQASKAAERCAEATTIRMLVSPISRRPRR